MHPLLNFKNEKLLLQALTHRSYVNENQGGSKHNERLEFLGDALLTFICAEYLHDRFPEMEEDEMTRRRAALVDEKQLARFAEEVDITYKMRLSQGAIRQGGYQNKNLLSSTFEAVVAAYYIDNDRNMDILRDCIISLFESVPPDALEIRSSVDIKNCLQTFVQGLADCPSLQYKTERCGGSDHAPEFLARVQIGGKVYGEGKGKSKKDAEKQAAEKALSQLKKNCNLF